jgi:ATP-binding cassette subfamily B protein
MACAERLLELVEKEPQTPDKPNAKVLNDAKGNVDIRNISFSYTEDKPLIRDFSVCVPHGSRVAIVGPTGCGKTTLIGLLMRFYDVDKGEILVDSADIRNITRNSLRRSYGMVLQDTWIKTATVRENITIGKPDATEAEIIAAAKASHAHSFIKRLPKGYDTVISDDSGLSQGQKQLLCITRVMLALPPMLILDEATSSIDTRTEMRIQNAFAKMMQGRTSFIVAHRLSTIREADMILVMNEGQIVETGTHESLLAQNGFYANLYNSQFSQ